MKLAIIIIILLIILVVSGMTVTLVLSQKSQKKRRALEVIKGQGSAASGPQDKKDEQHKRRAEIAKKLKDTKEEEQKEKKKKKTSLAVQLSQAGLEISEKKYWLYCVFSMFGCALAAQFMGQSYFIIGMAAVIGLLGLPKFVLKKMAAKRQKKFLEEFPDALEAMVRLLRAGMPVSEAVLMISREFTGPVGEEMSRVYDKQKIGVALHEAALEATQRMPITEMQMFATGLAIQAQTGSSLSEVLTNLSNVIRARFRLKRKIKALSSEAIASASIIGALPNVVALGMYFVNREYIDVLFTDPFGQVLLVGAIIWMLMGIFMMKAMINFKI